MARRGEIYWIDMPDTRGSEQRGRRPYLIIQNDRGNRTSDTTIVAAITSQPRQREYPFHVAISGDESGLRLSGTVLCEQIRTVDLRRLGPLAGALAADKMHDVDEALHRSLGLGF